MMDQCILGLVGLIFSGFGGYMFYQERRFFKTAIRVPGVVVSYEERRGHKGGKVYAPVVAFEFDGEKRQVTGTLYSAAKPQIGKSCTVGVDPYDISKARVYGKGNFVFFGLFFVIGLGLLAGAVYTFFTN